MRNGFLIVGDIIALYAALFLTLIIRYGGLYTQYTTLHAIPFTIIFVLWIFVLYIAGAYDLHGTKNDISFYRALLIAVGVNLGLTIAFFYLSPSFGITPRANLALFSIIVAVLMVGWRAAFNTLVARTTTNATLIVGNNPQSQELYDYLLSNPQLGYRALGIIDITNESARDALAKVASFGKVKTVILSREALSLPQITNELYALLRYRITFYLLSDFYENITGKVPLGTIDQAWFLENLSEGSKRRFDTSKRALDAVFSVIGLAITLPFYPLIALAIKLDSRGPVFIKQKRVGKAGVEFYLYKFRNMFSNSPDGSAEGASGPQWAIEDDPRVTRVGKIIRKTRLDEIPQFWNILKGEMSFVGPRPERPEFHAQLKEKIPFYEERSLTKPGLTGWAQIKYMLDFRVKMTVDHTIEKLKYDLYYIKHRSFLLDISIILKTLKIVVGKVV